MKWSIKTQICQSNFVVFVICDQIDLWVTEQWPGWLTRVCDNTMIDYTTGSADNVVRILTFGDDYFFASIFNRSWSSNKATHGESLMWCPVMWYGVTSCYMMWYGIKYYGVIWRDVIWCSVMWFGMVLWDVVLCDVSCNVIWYDQMCFRVMECDLMWCTVI